MGIASEVEVKYGAGDVDDAHHAMIGFGQATLPMHSSYKGPNLWGSHPRNLWIRLRLKEFGGVAPYMVRGIVREKYF